MKKESSGWGLGREAGLVYMVTEMSFSLLSYYVATGRRGRSSRCQGRVDPREKEQGGTLDSLGYRGGMIPGSRRVGGGDASWGSERWSL